MDLVDLLPQRQDIFIQTDLNFTKNEDLPSGYNYYILVYNGAVDLKWIKTQKKRLPGKFAVVSTARSTLNIKDLEFFTFVNWHKYKSTWTANPNKTHKFSIDTGTLSQSSIWIVSKLLDHNKDCIFDLDVFSANDENLNEWGFTSNNYLDDLTEQFRNKYNFNIKPVASLNSAALYFAITGFQYSFMMDEFKPYIYPGPYISDNILDCLSSGQAFIPCGQFEIYKTLKDYGFDFNYGFNTQWDSDRGNLTRFSSICKLIDELAEFSINDLLELTKESTAANQEHYYSQAFNDACDNQNTYNIKELHKYVN